jgi:hypothetical protein
MSFHLRAKYPLKLHTRTRTIIDSLRVQLIRGFRDSTFQLPRLNHPSNVWLMYTCPPHR